LQKKASLKALKQTKNNSELNHYDCFNLNKVWSYLQSLSLVRTVNQVTDELFELDVSVMVSIKSLEKSIKVALINDDL